MSATLLPKVKVAGPDLLDLVASVLIKNGLRAEAASHVARTVVSAERDGSLSHGIQRVPGYVASLRAGWVDGRAEPVVEDSAPSLVAVDARNGFCQFALAKGSALLQEKARASGMAAIAIRDSHHFGSLWPDVEPFGANGFIAIGMVNSRSRMVAWGGKKKILGTNPLAFACPRPGHRPLVWDQASSVMSQGDLLLCAASGEPVPVGIGVDREGRPTTDPKAILDGGALLPYSGAKGSSIAFLVEVLAAGLTGGRFGFQDNSGDFPGAQTSNAGQFILLIDPGAVRGNDFAARIEMLIEQIRAAGSERMPADNRYRRRDQSDQEGFEVNAEHYRYILEQLAS